MMVINAWSWYFVLPYRRTTKRYSDFPSMVIFRFLLRKFVTQTWFCNCQQDLCLFHIVFEYIPSIHDQGKMLVLPKSTSLFRTFHIGSMFCFFPANSMSSTYKDKNNPCSRCTNKHSQFGNLLPTVLQTGFSQIAEKNWRVSLRVQELCYPQDFLWLLAPIPGSQNLASCPVLNRALRFFLVFVFLVGMVNGSHRSFRSTCELDTGTGWESIPLKSSRAQVSRSLDTVMVGEVDEFEEDARWSISCLESVMDVEEWKLEEELVDKPGTTIGTKFSVLHCIRIPFLMRCGFWLLIHS